jgi:hypothetical protein
MSISDDVIEKINKIFYSYFKDDPEFQYNDSDYEEKDIIVEIDNESSVKYQNEIHLHFVSKKIMVIKNLNITKNLIVYPYFYDFLPPTNIIDSVIKYFVNKKEVPRDKLNIMLFEKESVNEDRNIRFIFPKTCLKNIGNKLYIHEFGREIIQLTINYINFKLINKLLLKNMMYEKRLEKIENALSIKNDNLLENIEDEYSKIYLKDYIKHDLIKPDAGKPDAGKPDAGKPDAGKPDAGKPENIEENIIKKKPIKKRVVKEKVVKEKK